MHSGTIPSAAAESGSFPSRNRTYDPHLGRFLQHDPNGTGQVLSGLAFEGKLGWTPPTAFDHSAWFGDGGNLYAAYGHDPVDATDPSGLFFSLAGLAVAQGFDNWSTATDALDTAYIGISNGVSLADMVGNYSAMQVFDVEWATNWDFHDDAFSRSGIGYDDTSEYVDVQVAQWVIAKKSGFPERLNPFRDNHGGPKHRTKITATLNKFSPGQLKRTRMNQALVGSDGQVLRGPNGETVRPDIQYVDRNGTIHVFEIFDSAGKSKTLSKGDIYKMIGEANGVRIVFHPPISAGS